MRRRRLVLAVIIAVAIGVLSAVSFFVWWEACPSHDDNWGVEIRLGKVQTTDAGMRAAIKRLDVETKRCPNVYLYRIFWSGPEDRVGLLYVGGPEPGKKWLGYEADVYSGTVGRTYLVDRDAIHAVATAGGTLDDFDQYDQSPPSSRESTSWRHYLQ